MAIDIGKVSTVEELGDRLAIQEVLHSHSRGLDRGDVACICACYWPDAEVDYGAFKGPAHTFAAAVVPALTDAYELTHHAVTNTIIHFFMHQARVESYVSASHLLRGARREMIYTGRYLDTLVRHGSQWKLQHRQVVMDWSRRRKVTDQRQSESFVDLSKGRNDMQDPLYDFLGVKGSSE